MKNKKINKDKNKYFLKITTILKATFQASADWITKA